MTSNQPANLQPPAEVATGENGQQAPPDEEIWDEERLEKAMKTLKEMHIQVGFDKISKIWLRLRIVQLRGLRTTLPRLIAPLTTKQPSRMHSTCPLQHPITRGFSNVSSSLH